MAKRIAPSLQFLGHAGYVVTRGPLMLVVDPWIDGPAFDNGWDLVVPSARFDTSALTHLWLSHEHPDHLNMGAVKSIPPAHRPKVTVIFQKTADRRVARFLQGQGFGKVVEVESGERVSLDEGATLTTVMARDGDSCHLLEIDGFRLINFNDCFYDSVSEVEDVLRALHVTPGSIDLLATQFSYANWVGNQDQPERRRDAAARKLEHLAMQVRTVEPKYALPFASFVYFSHEENAYLNDSANPPSRAAAKVRDAGSVPVLLRPGDEVELDATGLAACAAEVEPRGRELDAMLLAVQRGEKPRRTSQPVPLEALVATIREGLKRLREGVSKVDSQLMKLQLPHAVFALRDQPWVIVIDRLQHVHVEPADDAPRADVVVSSEALRFAFSQDFGFDTLLVNGRFAEARPSGATAIMKLCGQFGYARRKQSLVASIVQRRVIDAPRLAVEKLRNRALPSAP